MRVYKGVIQYSRGPGQVLFSVGTILFSTCFVVQDHVLSLLLMCLHSLTVFLSQLRVIALSRHCKAWEAQHPIVRWCLALPISSLIRPSNAIGYL